MRPSKLFLIVGLWMMPHALAAAPAKVLESWADHPVLRGAEITCLAALEDRVYAGTVERGVLEVLSGKEPARFLGTADWGRVHAAAVQRGNVYFATDRGLRCIGDPPARLKPYLAREEAVLGVAAHPDRLAWITREKIGLAVGVIAVTVTFETPSDMWIAKDSPLELATSASQLAYGGDGNLVTFAGFAWNHYFMRMMDKRVTALAMEDDGVLWAGTRNGLVKIPAELDGFGGAKPVTWFLEANGTWTRTPDKNVTHVTALAPLGPLLMAVGTAGRSPALHVASPAAVEPLLCPEIDEILDAGAGERRVVALAAQGKRLWVAGPKGLACLDPPAEAAIPRDPFLPQKARRDTGGISIHMVNVGDLPRRVAPSRRIGATADADAPPGPRPAPFTPRRVTTPPPTLPPPAHPGFPAVPAGVALIVFVGMAALLRTLRARIDRDLADRIQRADLLADAIDQRLVAIPAAQRYFGSSVDDILRLANEVERQGQLAQELRRCGRAGDAIPMMDRMDQLVAFLDSMHLALIRLSANGSHTPEGGWSALEDRLRELSREIEDIARNLASGK